MKDLASREAFPTKALRHRGRSHQVASAAGSHKVPGAEQDAIVAEAVAAPS